MHCVMTVKTEKKKIPVTIEKSNSIFKTIFSLELK